MDTINNSERIIRSWSLIGFAQAKGSDLRVGTCKAESGEEFPAMTFSNGTDRTFVHFGKSLPGGLTFEEIAAQARDLQVVQLTVEPEVLKRRQEKGAQLETYTLCKVGENAWQGGDLLAAIA